MLKYIDKSIIDIKTKRLFFFRNWFLMLKITMKVPQLILKVRMR